jgi:hypothetical protein
MLKYKVLTKRCKEARGAFKYKNSNIKIERSLNKIIKYLYACRKKQSSPLSEYSVILK